MATCFGAGLSRSIHGASWPRRGTLISLVTLVVIMHGPSASGKIDLEWGQSHSELCHGEVLEIGLYAVSDDETDQSMIGAEIILLWDPLKLKLLGKIDNGPYLWLSSFFPNDSGSDGLNEPFTSPVTPFVPDNDGDALYSVFAQFSPQPPAFATPAGLLITTFRFEALGAGVSNIEIPASYATTTETQIVDGFTPGLIVTGALPTVTTGVRCPNITATTVGSRRIKISVENCPGSVAIRIAGAISDPSVSCIDAYAQFNGNLDSTALFQNSPTWGTLYAHDEVLIPEGVMTVQADCGTAEVPSLGDMETVQLETWGDLDGSGQVDLDDIIVALDAFAGQYLVAPLEAIDIFPCDPQGVVDLDDLLVIIDAFQGYGFSNVCSLPCPP